MADRNRLDSDDAPAQVLNWPQPVEAVLSSGLAFDRVADADEREALRENCGLITVSRMEAHFTVKPWRKTGYSVIGRVTADVEQACVVSLEPVSQRVDEEVSVKFVPLREAEKWVQAPDEDGEIVVDVEADDPPDFFEGNAIDLGALAAEYFALGLDPYPRAPGVSFEAALEAEEAGQDDRRKPFAGLKDMMKARDGES
ncbi:DUF177 domain-containing protein [Breoghania sp.]|uniref:DUF177 domain-containing protein n=1 Tax=Breoghania sp. TaxID=2065378 RepID=UPI002AAA70F7|nr:DUF177 domain-containing protein [Breoghania sp.]